MGIRVDSKSLDEQLTKAGCDGRRVPLPQAAAGGKAAPHHRRRHRTVPAEHAAAGKRPTSARFRSPSGTGHQRGCQQAGIPLL